MAKSLLELASDENYLAQLAPELRDELREYKAREETQKVWFDAMSKRAGIWAASDQNEDNPEVQKADAEYFEAMNKHFDRPRHYTHPNAFRWLDREAPSVDELLRDDVYRASVGWHKI